MFRFFLPVRRYVRRSGLPGINKLSKELKDVQDVMEDPEGFGELESDFMEVHKTHKEHEREMHSRRLQIRHFIVGNKYFKTKQPNFLTYAEKEQIRLLHARDPDEWDLEKLSESFPATPEIISKIIKASWLAKSSERIKRHDQSVIENWKTFSNGKFVELDPALEEHLRKFSKRSLKDLQSMEITIRPKPELPKPSRTEFSSIITESMKFRKSAQIQDESQSSVEKIAASSTERPSPTRTTPTENPFKADKPPPPPMQKPAEIANNFKMEEETYLMDKVVNRKPIRFQDLVRQTPGLQQDSKIVAMHGVDNPQGTGILPSDTANISTVKKFITSEIEINPRDMVSSTYAIRERIHIPNHLWNRGSTYKLSDCYYDDDGEFLYRVPGMTGRNVK